MISFLGKFFPIFARPASRREELTELLQESLGDKTSFDSHEGTLLQNFLGLRDTTAADVMVPRADIVSVALADGFDDIIVGGHLHGQDLNGAAYILFGPAIGTELANADIRWTGGIDAHLGYEVSPAGDLNGDGIMDVMVAAYRDPGFNGIFHGGATYFLYGP